MHKYINCFYCCCFLLLSVFCSNIANAAKVSKKKTEKVNAIFIDSRLLVLAHPLFNAYDTKTGRFRGTPSEPFVFDVESRKYFLDQIKETEEKLLKFPEILKNKLKDVPFKDRIAIEKEFLIQKKLLEAKLEAMKMRIYFSRQVPISQGMTPYKAIYPQCSDITETALNIVKELKEKYKTDIVIDVANILPIIKKDKYVKPISVDYNLMKKAYDKNEKVSSEEIEIWIDKADKYWSEQLELDADIIPYGAIDARLEAIKLMEEKGKRYKIWDWENDNREMRDER